ARGGMAEVFEVEDRASGEHLALKLLVQTGGATARFNREYEAMIRLNHPNIVRVYAYGLLGDHPWLSMELVEGTPIQAYAKRCGRPGTRERLEEVIRVAHDLALALDHIHLRGLVHRDLKSANVLVLPDGRVKLIDFGTARVSEAYEEITREGEFIGTFAYASPEQILNKPVDGRADLYSFGVLLYRLITGKRPFDSDDIGELARMHVKGEPPPPSRHTDVPPALEAIILKLLSKNPEERPKTGSDVAAALERVVGRPLYLPGTLEIDLAAERLVGREEQVRALWGFLDGQGAGDGEAPGCQSADMALVVGLPGSGREQLLEAMDREVVDRGWRPVTAYFRQSTDDLEQFTEMLTDLARTFGAGASVDVVEAVQDLRQVRRSTGLSVAERLEVIRQVAATLVRERTRLDKTPLVLIVRGLQHAGPVGFEAIVGLREELRQHPASFLLLGELTENADDPQSMARKRLPDALRVTLPPMTVREVALLVGALLHRRPPPAAVARQIYEASGGLPAYVEEVVKGLVADGLLRARGRDQNRIEWAQREEIAIPVPAGARERLIDQLATLPVDRRRALEAMALCGGEASVKVLAGSLQCRSQEIMPALEDLAHRGWITLGKRRRLPYAKMRQVLAEDVVRQQIHPCRRRVLQRLLIDEVADEPAFVAQIELLLEVGRVEQGLLRARDWAIHHLSKNRPVTALEVLDFVIPKLEDLEGGDELLRAQLYLLHATSLLNARPTDPQTSKSLAKADRIKIVGNLFEAELHLTKARIQRVIGHYPNFRKELMEAWNLVENAEPSPLAATVATLLGWSNRMSGQVDDAATWHGRARRIAVQVGTPVVRAHADVGVASWQFARGLLIEAERTAAGAVEILAEAGDVRGLSQGLPVWVDALRLQGRSSEALARLDAHLPAMRESEVPTYYVRMLLANAWVEVDLGRLGRAQECVDELAATLRKGEHLDLRLQSDLVWGRILLASELYPDAVQRLHEVRNRAAPAGLGVITELARALEAEALWALGEQKPALKMFTAAVQQLQRTGDVPALASACTAQARAMSETVDPDLVFRPVRDWMEQQPAALFRVEKLIARGRYLRAMGRSYQETFEEASRTIGDIVRALTPTDAAALRLHPWTRRVRAVRKATPPPRN
ncbi:MAG: protein kinase, partial [Myxococcales bacterium]|nr:protein kinase [Myxococcales bacterium]